MIVRTSLLALALLGTHPSATEPPSPASGHAEVVAQGLVTFDANPAHWLLIPMPVTQAPITFETVNPTFLASTGPAAVLVSGADGPLAARLASGEATFAPGGGTHQAATLSPSTGTITGIAIVPGAGTSQFQPGPGVRDVDLVRDVLATNEALILKADISAFVVVAAGSVTAGATIISAGSGVALAGTITLINTSPTPAVVLAAVVGPAIDGGAASPVATVETVPPAGGTPSGPSATTPPTQPPSTPPATPATTLATTTTTSTTTTTTTTEPPADTDSDGLTDAEEANLGTDPNSPDSDGDGLPDGREVNSLATDPLNLDTDGDGLSDGQEFDHSCDPKVVDTDGDGLSDKQEVIFMVGALCSISDSDGDGVSDGAEYAAGTDWSDPSSKP